MNNGLGSDAYRVASAFELSRGMSGRRSLAQVRAWEWSIDPEPYLGLLSIFEPRTDQLLEPTVES